jgi:hypothetical protein
MTTNKPITVNGIIYDTVAASLSSMPMFKDTEVGQTVAIRLQYFTRDENGIIIRPEDSTQYDVPVVYGDVTTSGDPDALVAFTKITEAIQEYINAKGL